MSREVVTRTPEEVLQAFKSHTTESVALDIVSTLSCPSEIKDKDKSTLLHIACYNGWYTVTKQLIKKLCDPKAKDVNGNTPLHLACKSGSLDLVKYLILKKNCDPSEQNSQRLVPLHNAVSAGHIGVAKYLIEEKKCDPNPQDTNGMTPLHFACLSGNLHIIKYFIEEQNCDPACSTNDHYTTTLHLACQNGHLEVVKYLLEEKHCNPTSLNKDGFQPVHLACKSGSLSLTKYLIEKHNCKADCISRSYSYTWWTPMHVACEYGSLEVAKYLIKDKNCNPSPINSEGTTPLHLACRNGHLLVAKYLIDQGCDPNCKKKNGCTPLHSACQNGHLNIAVFLIETNRVHPTCKSSNYWSPLHLACENGHLDLVKYLIDDRHCDPNSKTYHGDSPLSLAYKSRHLPLLVYLVKECKCNALDSGIILTDNIVKNYPEIALFLVASTKLVDKPINAVVESDMLFLPVFKVFVLGHQSVGKTTFIKAIQSHLESGSYWITEQLMSRLGRRISEEPSQSGGITPVRIKSYPSQYHFIMYDFAGGSNYHASHATFLENIKSMQDCLVMIVFDISRSLEVCVHDLQYWVSLIDNQLASQHSAEKPTFVLVASHADIVKSNDENPVDKTNQILKKAFGDRHVHYDNIITDCRLIMSEGLKTLSMKLCTLFEKYKKTLEIDIQVHFLHYLLRKYSMHERLLCKLVDLKCLICSEENIVLKNSGLIPTDSDITELSRHLTILSESGEVLFLQDPEDINLSWVVFNTDFLLSTMTTTLFSVKSIVNSTGVASLSDIEKMFPSSDPKMLAGLMTHLDICCEINEFEARLISKDKEWCSTNTTSENYYFFPGLVNAKMPLECEMLTSQYRCGWHCRHTNIHEFSTPRFMQTILLKLMNKFMISECEEQVQNIVEQKICSVWKTGMQWQNVSGMQAFVKVLEEDVVVMVEVGCLKERELECLSYRDKIVETILQVKHKVLRAVQIDEIFFKQDEQSQTIGEYESADRKG